MFCRGDRENVVHPVYWWLGSRVGVSVCVRGRGGWTASMPNPMYEGRGEYTLLAQVGLT